MKNTIIVLLFLFAFTITANAQEAKAPAKKESSCCSADKKTAGTDAKNTCSSESHANADKNTKEHSCTPAEKAKCSADAKTTSVSSVTPERHSCKADGSCCGGGEKPKAKS